MGGAGDVKSTPLDLGRLITRGFRERSREHYECDLCARVCPTEPGLWAHTKDNHPEVCPEDEFAQQQLRSRKKDLCYRKLSDTSARNESQQPLPPNQLPAPVRWQVLDMVQDPGANKPGPGDLAGVSRGAGNSDVQEIEKKTSHITLHQPDTSMLARGSNARKRTGPDTSLEYPVTPSPLNVSRDDQSPKRSRPQSAAPPLRGNITSAIKRLPGAAHPDPEFDRSRYQADPSPEEGTRPAVTTRRLYDPDSDLPGARVDEKYSSKRLEESTLAHRPYTRTKREPKKRGLGTGHGQRFTQIKPASPHLQPPASREGGQMMILKLGGQYPQPPTSFLGNGEDIVMVSQPETRPISPEQLIAEVKGIYAGLVMVEAKCSEVDAKQIAICHEGDHSRSLNSEQWQALTALHRTLLHEHHDFFLASQHPSASHSLRRLASKYSMPARMWKHGIYSFLELLRYRLPHSREHMLTFIYIAYSMMALLYETVSAFENTWIECLGDLGRYRMGIEDNDDHDREVWASVSRSWYSKAADKMPDVGRLYHHLAILAEPNILDQLFYYCKSLGVTSPFHPARESILTLFDPIFSADNAAPQSALVDTRFIQLHGISFTHVGLERFNETLFDYLDVLDKHIGDPQSEWKVPGCYMAICNIVGLYQYGAKDSLLRLAWREGRSKQNPEEEMEDAPPASQCGDGETGTDFEALLPPIPSGASSEHVTSLLPPRSKLRVRTFSGNKTHQKSDTSAGVDSRSWGANTSSTTSSLGFSKRLAYEILRVVVERTGDSNVLPHIHVWLVFLAYITSSAPAMLLLENEFPWKGLVDLLNSLVAKHECDRFEDDEFPVPEKGIWRPLPEDYTLRGLDWAKRYFPDGWFQCAQVGDEERSMELPSMENIRIERILWLATRVAANGEWLAYSARRFEVHPALLHRIQQHQKREALIAQELEAARMTPTLDDSDIEMASGGNDSDGDYVLVGESEEFRRLKQKKLQLQSQLNTNGMNLDSVQETTQTIFKGPEALKPDYTVLVVDTNLLLSHPDAFELMVSTNNWPVVIPNIVITELLGLTNKLDSTGDAAKRAIISINEAVTEKRGVKVVTAKGNNVTNIGFYKEQLDKQRDEEFRNLDDVIIGTAKQQGEARRQAMPGNFGDSEPSVLVTEDRNMRVKANARGVMAIAASVLKRTLARHAERSNSERLKRKSFLPPVPGPQEPADDEVLLFPVAGSAPSNSISSHELFSQSHMARRKKRLHKRGRTEGTDTIGPG